MEQIENANRDAVSNWKFIYAYSPKVIQAFVKLVFGFWFISVLTSGFRKQMQQKDMDPSLVHFVPGPFILNK